MQIGAKASTFLTQILKEKAVVFPMKTSSYAHY
jgi:hypothetical protein